MSQRKRFTHAAAFGDMPGVPPGPGSCEIINEGDSRLEYFKHSHTEQTYSLWLRGYNAALLDVRDKLNELAHLPDTSENREQLGHCYPREIGLLLQQLQRIEFLPMRPGD